jgi:hypothetical protein
MQHGAFDDENEMVMGAIMSDIADQLLDEGQLYSDYQIASRCDSNYLKGRFNQFYDLNPNDQYYVEVNE